MRNSVHTKSSRTEKVQSSARSSREKIERNPARPFSEIISLQNITGNNSVAKLLSLGSKQVSLERGDKKGFFNSIPTIKFEQGPQAQQHLNAESAIAATKGNVIRSEPNAFYGHEGRLLLAHELRHVLQERSVELPRAPQVKVEADADNFARNLCNAQPAAVSVSRPSGWAYKKRSKQPVISDDMKGPDWTEEYLDNLRADFKVRWRQYIPGRADKYEKMERVSNFDKDNETHLQKIQRDNLIYNEKKAFEEFKRINLWFSDKNDGIFDFGEKKPNWQRFMEAAHEYESKTLKEYGKLTEAETMRKYNLTKNEVFERLKQAHAELRKEFSDVKNSNPLDLYFHYVDSVKSYITPLSGEDIPNVQGFGIFRGMERSSLTTGGIFMSIPKFLRMIWHNGQYGGLSDFTKFINRNN